jgi:hypothetical protein
VVENEMTHRKRNSKNQTPNLPFETFDSQNQNKAKTAQNPLRQNKKAEVKRGGATGSKSNIGAGGGPPTNTKQFIIFFVFFMGE